MKAQGATLAGSVLGGLLASACCLGPLVLSLLGLSGAAFAQRFEPLRPYLLVVTYGLLGAAFYLTYRRARTTCGPRQACQMQRTSRLGKAMLWSAAVVVILTSLFPLYAAALSMASARAGESTAEAVLAVKGMTCGGCVAAVEVQLRRTEGVTAFEVSLERGEAEVTYDPARIDPQKIAESVSKTGFHSTVNPMAKTSKGS